MWKVRLESEDEAQYGSAIRPCHWSVLVKGCWDDVVEAQMKELELTGMNKEDAIPFGESFRTWCHIDASWTSAGR
jgi:hypothetical protein